VSTSPARPDLSPPPVPPGIDGLQHSTITLPTGHLDLTHPRDAMQVLYQHNFGADGTDPPYWAQPWPCGIELARAIATAVSPGTRVLELGCGLALPSLAAARAGGHVLATDHAEAALAFATYNARRNHLCLDVETCTWADPTAATAGAPWDVVLAADVLYRHPGLDALLALLPRLVDDTGQIWIADQARPPAHDFLAACTRWATITTTDTANPEVTIHHLRTRAHQPQEPGSPLNGPTTSAVIHPP
jgi:predicted nicotinamide N-methyase